MTSDPAASPAAGEPTRRSRLVGLDVARGLALVGMIAVHVAPSGGPGDPVPWADAVAGGRASALFAVLAGCGLALATGGATPWTGGPLARARRGIAARAAVVASVGLTVGGLPTPAAVILAYYGLLFLVALPVLGWGPRRLAVAAIGCLGVAPVVSHLLRRASPRAPGPNVGWAELLTDPAGLVRTLLLDGYYPVLTWSMYLLLGLAVGRLPLRSARTALGVAAAGAAAAAAGLVTGAVTVAAAGGAQALGATTQESAQAVAHRLATSSYGTSPTGSWWWLGTAGRHSGTPADLLHTGGSALVVIGLCLVVAVAGSRSAAGRRLVAPVVALGATTLTIYTLHVLALGASADWDVVQDATTGTLFAGHVVLALAVAAVTGAPQRRGPLEGLAAAAARAAAGPGGGAVGGRTPGPADAFSAARSDACSDASSDDRTGPSSERGRPADS
jgi:uncharacterized membrane protein